MKIEEYLYSGILGFCFGAMAMGYVADYNRSKLPFALLIIAISILSKEQRKLVKIKKGSIKWSR